MKIGFIGLGNLGHPLAMSLVKAGHDVTVSDLRPECGAAFIEAGAKCSDNIADVCRDAEAVITALPSPEASRAVVEKAGGVFDHLSKGSCWIEMSTTDFEDIQRLSGVALKKGFNVLECPVTGGVHLAHTGEITVLVGGKLKRVTEESADAAYFSREEAQALPTQQWFRKAMPQIFARTGETVFEPTDWRPGDESTGPDRN